MSIKAFMDLARIEHSVFLALAVLIGEVVVASNIDVLQTLLGMLSVFCIGIASFTLNDFLDYPTDKKNKRLDRPLVTKKISMWAAIASAKILFPLGVLFSLFINMDCFIIAVVFSVIAIAYSYYLKKVVMLGNIFIAFSMAVPFIFGNYILTDQLNRTVLLLSSMAFLVGVGREIIKSIQDMKGDAKTGRRTMPIVMGKESSAIFASYYILMALLLSPLPYLFDPRFQDLFYLVPVFATDVLLIKTIIYALRLKKLEKARKISLMALGIGLAGFLLSALF